MNKNRYTELLIFEISEMLLIYGWYNLKIFKKQTRKEGFAYLHKYLRHIKWEIEAELRNKSTFLKKISVYSSLVLHKNTEAVKHSKKTGQKNLKLHRAINPLPSFIHPEFNLQLTRYFPLGFIYTEMLREINLNQLTSLIYEGLVKHC